MSALRGRSRTGQRTSRTQNISTNTDCPQPNLEPQAPEVLERETQSESSRSTADVIIQNPSTLEELREIRLRRLGLIGGGGPQAEGQQERKGSQGTIREPSFGPSTAALHQKGAVANLEPDDHDIEVISVPDSEVRLASGTKRRRPAGLVDDSRKDDDILLLDTAPSSSRILQSAAEARPSRQRQKQTSCGSTTLSPAVVADATAGPMSPTAGQAPRRSTRAAKAKGTSTSDGNAAPLVSPPATSGSKKRHSSANGDAETCESSKGKKPRRSTKGDAAGHTLAGDTVIEPSRERKWRSKCTQATLQRGKSRPGLSCRQSDMGTLPG